MNLIVSVESGNLKKYVVEKVVTTKVITVSKFSDGSESTTETNFIAIKKLESKT